MNHLGTQPYYTTAILLFDHRENQRSFRKFRSDKIIFLSLRILHHILLEIVYSENNCKELMSSKEILIFNIFN